MKNIYRPLEAAVEKVIAETPTIKTLVLKPKIPFEFRTGQFIELTVPGAGEAPFTPSSDPAVKESFELTVMRAGRITELIHNLAPGAVVGVRGPYGKGYPLEDFYGKDILIVGGGVGLAPLRSLLLTLFGSLGSYRKVVLRYGCRSPKDMVYGEALRHWAKKDKVDVAVTVDAADKDYRGHVGVVTTILDKLPLDIKKAVAVVCGPPIMMKFSTFKLLELGFTTKGIYLSMEKNMSCGLGKCGHCRIGRYYACKDGPVFTYAALENIPEIWD